METVKYSLNNSIYNIDNQTISIKNFTKRIDNNTSKNKKITNTHLFDKYCIELYGEKTCILFHINTCNYKI